MVSRDHAIAFQPGQQEPNFISKKKKRYPKMWKQLWNWVTCRGWNSLEGSEEDRKMLESLELPRDLLMALPEMLVAIWTTKSSLKWCQMEMRNLLGTGAKVALVMF